MSSTVRLRGEAAEVALGEAQAVLAMVQDAERRGRLADVLASVRDGEVRGTEAEALEELLELGLHTGRIRALYGPGGEQAALKLYRQLPGGRELGRTAAGVSEALTALVGKRLDSVKIQATGPGAFLVSLTADGLELSVRLDRHGARLTTVGV